VDLPIRKDHQLLYVMAYNAQKLSLDLSAGIADSFRNMTLDKIQKNAKLIIF